MIVEVCPNCQAKRDPTERFCWWCQEDLMKHDTTCYECGNALRTGHESFDPKGFRKAFREVLEG